MAPVQNKPDGTLKKDLGRKPGGVTKSTPVKKSNLHSIGTLPGKIAKVKLDLDGTKTGGQFLGDMATDTNSTSGEKKVAVVGMAPPKASEKCPDYLAWLTDANYQDDWDDSEEEYNPGDASDFSDDDEVVPDSPEIAVERKELGNPDMSDYDDDDEVVEEYYEGPNGEGELIRKHVRTEQAKVVAELEGQNQAKTGAVYRSAFHSRRQFVRNIKRLEMDWEHQEGMTDHEIRGILPKEHGGNYDLVEDPKGTIIRIAAGYYRDVKTNTILERVGMPVTENGVEHLHTKAITDKNACEKVAEKIYQKMLRKTGQLVAEENDDGGQGREETGEGLQKTEQ